jgi:hypothetical protein
MIPRIITDTAITFVAKGQAWVLAADHPAFEEVKKLLIDDTDDVDQLVRLSDVRVAVNDVTQGQAVLSEDGLFLNGVQLPDEWAAKAAEQPEATRVLLVSPGDTVRVEGDEDAPDGIYTVGEVDDTDVNKRIYVESEDDYFGFVDNASIKEIIQKRA